MREAVFMIIPILIILGIACFYHMCFRFRGAEGLVLAVLSVILGMRLGALFGSFQYGVIMLVGLGCLGILVFAIHPKQLKAGKYSNFFEPGLVLFILGSLGSVLLFYGDFIQNIDDFHQWGIAVKYMLEKDRVITTDCLDFTGDPRLPMATSYFHLFFQKIVGYNEGNMYASSFIFSLVPACLMLGKRKWKLGDVLSSLVFLVALYLGYYSLYVHPYKSLYVDLPCACWAAGIAIWWKGARKEEGKIKHGICFVCFLVFLSRIKYAVGALFGAFVLFYAILLCFTDGSGKKVLNRFKKRPMALALSLVGLVILGFAGGRALVGRLPGSLSATIEALSFSSKKAKLTFQALVAALWSKEMTNYSRLKINLIIFLAAFFLLLALATLLLHSRRFFILGIYGFVVSVGYLLVLYVTYVSTFSYEESIRVSAIHRYFSILAIFLYALLLSYFLEEKKAKIFLALCLLVMATGVNSYFLAKASALDSEKIYRYKSIVETKRRIEKIDQVAGEDARVYLLVQGYSLDRLNELPMAVTSYYKADTYSNYLRLPWKFNEEGSLIFVTQQSYGITGLPTLLKEGNYGYLWIYSYDAYLKNHLQEIADFDGKVRRGLYQVSFREDGRMILKFVNHLS